MEMQKQNDLVITQQPQVAPNVVVVQSPPPRNNVPAIGALVFSIVTLVCCPGSLFCTIPSCICAIVAMNGNGSESEKMLYVVSYVATGVFWILTIISVIVIVILAVAGVFSSAATADDKYYNYFDNYYFG